MYKSTIGTQEKVIAKLEELMESKLKNRAGSGAGSVGLKAEIQRLSQRNEQLEKQIIAGGGDSTRVKDLVQQLERARKALAEAKQGGGGASQEVIQAKDARIKILEQQLLESARSFATELSATKFKIMQLETLGGGMDSDDDF